MSVPMKHHGHIVSLIIVIASRFCDIVGGVSASRFPFSGCQPKFSS
jgi:hypothetical protein